MDHRVSINEEALVRQRRDVIAAEADGEMVVLDPDHGEFIELSRTAARIWTLLAEPTTIPALCQRLTGLFDIDAAACRAEVEAFIATLRERGLIETVSPDR
jgi:PqqD family protein of HPr-rel-A system